MSLFSKGFRIFSKSHKNIRITALLVIRDEEIYLNKCLDYLLDAGMQIVIIDNGSSDKSLEIIQSYIDEGKPIKVFDHPYEGYFNLEALLERLEEITEDIDTDWFLRTDADEIMEAPGQFSNLAEGIAHVDSQGYNTINFDELVFVPYKKEQSYIGKDYETEMKFYYFHEPSPLRLMRAWKKTKHKANFAAYAGHLTTFEGRNIYPENFILKHYIFLSYEYGLIKYTSQIFTKKSIDKGWHSNRYYLSSSSIILPGRNDLKELTEERIVR